MNKLSPQQLYDLYKRWVISKPNLVTDVENIATWSSFFIAGKINKSPIVSELVFSLSKLLSLFNDRLIKEAYGGEVHHYGLPDQIKLWLTIIHYTEVFVELVVKKKCGSRSKWTVVTMLQLFKCSSSLILLFKYKDGPVNHPPIPALQRSKFIEDKGTDENSNSFYTLKRSGRVIRSVEGSPPISFRDWQPIQVRDNTHKTIDISDLWLAESLHIVKPLTHLFAMRIFGTKSWTQWLVALGFDLASMKIYKEHMQDLSYEQRIEITRRRLCLVLYLLRSPMYNKYSMILLQNMLNSLSKVPVAGHLCGPILKYLNHWQEIYFYMWAS